MVVVHAVFVSWSPAPLCGDADDAKTRAKLSISLSTFTVLYFCHVSYMGRNI